jgi:hypothetical protein
VICSALAENYAQKTLTDSFIMFPFAFFEFTTDKVSTKAAQAFAYSHLLFRTLHQMLWVPLLGIRLSPHEMILDIYMLTFPDGYSAPAKIAVLELFRANAPQGKSLSGGDYLRLIHILVSWVELCKSFLLPTPPLVLDHQCLPNLIPVKNANVFLRNGRAFKSYDYREKDLESCYWRDPQYYFHFVDGCRWEVNEPKLKIISYDMIPGVHQPSCIDHLIKFLLQLSQVHQKEIVHGDIRLSNIIFNSHPEVGSSAHPEVGSSATVWVPQATIIDYDMSGPEATRVYPPRYAQSIPDGKRHPDALPEAPLRYSHDIYSALDLCRRYTSSLTNCDDQTSLDNIIEILRSCRDEDGAFQASSSPSSSTSFHATGSPHR